LFTRGGGSLHIFVTRLELFFFFSSRRRHTRSKRDWSSDVCSSDLTNGFSFYLIHIRGRMIHKKASFGLFSMVLLTTLIIPNNRGLFFVSTPILPLFRCFLDTISAT